jgi:hypothetical protein
MPIEMIQKAEQFPDTTHGWADRWRVEMDSAEENQRKWVERGDKVVKRFLDNREATVGGDTRINLFTANVQTLQALLYGKTPQVDVKRRFADPGDDQARVAGEILQRLLNLDIERDSDSYATALENALSDRLLPGLGVVRLRYEAEFEEQAEVAAVMDDLGSVLAPAYTPEPTKSYECVETDYVYWKDFRWSPARTWDEVRWVAFKADMTYDALVERFGEGHAKLVPMNAKLAAKDEDSGDKNNPWSRAEVWEIWSKEHRKVQWWVCGYDQILDEKDDPLGLDGFWPCPRPMFANCTTTKLIPTPDFVLAQDLYDEVDDISTRITSLERAINVRGVYDKTNEGVKRLLAEAVGNELIPIDDFSMFKEKGGLQAVVDWLPLDMVVGALDKLREYRSELMALLYQVTGMSDIMRGQASGKATATEQALKAKFASTRVQEFQNEFARFASDAQSIKAEIISKHYDPETILKQSNAQYMTGGDPQAAQAAIQLIKSDFYQYRIEVRPESVAMADMTAMKQERSEFLMAVATFLQSSQPVVAAAPWTAPFLLQMLQWSMAGFRGGSSIEGVLDQMVMAAQQQVKQQAMRPPPPDPKIEALKMKGQIDQQKAQTDMVVKKAGLQVDMQKAQMDLAVQQQKAKIELTKAGIEQKQAEISAAFDVQKMQQDLVMEARRNAMESEQSQQSHEQSMQQAKEKAAAAPKKTKE